MKNVTLLFIYFLGLFAHAQTASFENLENDTAFIGSKWSFKIGANIVDNSGDENPFDVFDIKKMGFSNPIALGVDYRFRQHWSLGLMVSNNKFLKSKSVVDGELLTEDLSYFATDLHLKYSFWSAQFEADKNFNFYLLGGLGNFKIVNSSPSYNVGFGSVYWLNDIVGFNIESIAKWSSNNVRYDSNHFQYFAGISFRLQRVQDSDKDGVADKDDACPNVYGFAALQGCPDSDNDGIADAQDACPDFAGTELNKGCPDSDGDGIVDAQDACPDVAGTELNKGCPDSDGDGIVDAKDACKYTSGPQENKGCPYKDTDDDGVLDKDDNCPKVKGMLSESGCPKEVEKVILDNTAAKLKTNKVLKEYPKNIYFQTAKATFTDEVYTVLHSILMELKEFPSSKIIIEGHADSIGSYDANKTLSDKRANAIKDYLVQNGIPLQNIEAVGYGERKPVASNMFKAGRSLNRRGHIKIKIKESIE